MHEYDAATQVLADRVLEYLRELAALDPAPLNGTIRPSELAALARKAGAGPTPWSQKENQSLSMA